VLVEQVCNDEQCEGCWTLLEDGTLQLTFTIAFSVDRPLQLLNDENPGLRQEAVEALAKAAKNDHERVTEALCICCATDPCFYVRQAAEKTLVQVARTGDENVMDVFSKRLALPDCSDRRFVLRTLARISADSENESMKDEMPQDDDGSWDGGAGLTVAQGLHKLALSKPWHGIAALASCLQDDNLSVRQAAGYWLGQLAHSEAGGAEHVVQTLDMGEQMLDEPTRQIIRQDDHLVLLCEPAAPRPAKEDSTVYSVIQKAVCKVIRRSDSLAKLNALETLISASRCNDMFAIMAVCQCLEDDDASIRDATIDGLQKISEVGNPGTIAAIQIRTKHKNSNIRQSAQAALHVVRGWNEEPLPILPRSAYHAGCHSYVKVPQSTTKHATAEEQILTVQTGNDDFPTEDTFSTQNSFPPSTSSTALTDTLQVLEDVEDLQTSFLGTTSETIPSLGEALRSHSSSSSLKKIPTCAVSSVLALCSSMWRAS